MAPIDTLSVVMVFAYTFPGEHVSQMQLAGCGLIAADAVLIAAAS